MEPNREEQQKAPEPNAEPKPRRFRIVKLEERVAAAQGGGTHSPKQCPFTQLLGCTFNCGGYTW